MRHLIHGINDLATLFPDIAADWDESRNGILKPSDVLPKSEKTVWWKGKCGHIWDAKIKERTNGCGCPYCAGKRVLIGFNDFASKHPQAALEWHPEKNGEKRAADYVEFSNKKVWWKCSKCGHEWETSLNKRANGQGCPKCGHKNTIEKLKRQAIQNGNSFAQLYPQIAKEWDYDKNGELRPNDVAPFSNQIVWWKCSSCGNEWKTSINKRSNGRNCPKCAYIYKTSEPEQMIYFYVRKVFPDAVNSWEPEWLLGRPVDIFIPSLQLAVEYDGGYFHDINQKSRDEFKTALLQKHRVRLIRIREKGAAPIRDGSMIIRCDNIRYDLSPLTQAINSLFNHINQVYNLNVCLDINIERDYPQIASLFYQRKKENSLAVCYPELLAEWDFEKNKLPPDLLPAKSSRFVYWKCEKGHEWKAVVNSRVRGNGCPICAGKKALKGFNDLGTLFPDLSEEWDYEKNEGLMPDSVTPGSNKKVWWKGKCGHEWQAVIRTRTRLGVGCPICCNKKLLIGFNDLATTHRELAKEWHPTKNGALSPEMVIAGSNKKAWWKCSTCGYEWESVINSRRVGTGCPCCANRIAVSGINDLETKYPSIAAEWDYVKNDGKRPCEVVPGSHSSAWWKCKKCGYEWKSMIRDRVRYKSSCPVCGNKDSLEGLNE